MYSTLKSFFFFPSEVSYLQKVWVGILFFTDVGLKVAEIIHGGISNKDGI